MQKLIKMIQKKMAEQKLMIQEDLKMVLLLAVNWR